MLRKFLIPLGIASVIAFGGIGFGSASASTSAFTVIATHVHFTTADVGDKGPSPGDELVFTAIDKNLAGDTVGRLDGYCVFTEITGGEDHWEECMLTHSLNQGQITLQGAFDQQATVDNVFAVTGGTGHYDEADGQAILRFTHRFRFDIELRS